MDALPFYFSAPLQRSANVGSWHQADLTTRQLFCPLSGAKWTSGEAAACFGPTRMTRLCHSMTKFAALHGSVIG